MVRRILTVSSCRYCPYMASVETYQVIFGDKYSHTYYQCERLDILAENPSNLFNYCPFEIVDDEKKEVKLNEKISEKERFTTWGNRIKDNGKLLNPEFKDKYDAKAFCKFLNYLNKQKQWAVDEVNELCMWHKEHYGKSILDERMGW